MTFITILVISLKSLFMVLVLQLMKYITFYQYLFQPVDTSNSDELWRLEFPPPPSDRSPRISSVTPQFITTIPERLGEDSSLPESEEDEQVSDKISNESSQPKVTSKDWEVQMLVQQFEKNVRQQRRRHSSADALTWDKVLHLRDVALVGHQGPESGRRHHRRKYSLVEEGTLHDWTGSSLVQSSSHTSLMEARGGQRTILSKSPRRRSYGQQKQFEPPTARKNSMPILPHCSSIGMSRWLSMDDAKSEGCRSQDSSLHTTLSSGYSQETVIGVESRFSSVDDVRRDRSTGLGMRSPSSPNVVTDRDCSTAFEYATTAGLHLPEWPSSPCLPTISEDEQSHTIVSLPTTSTGRSASLSTLPLGNHHNESSHNAQSFQNVRTLTGTSFRRRASADFGSRDQARSSSIPDNLCLVNNVRASIITTSSRGTSNNNIVDSPLLSPESSVVISIPEYEPLLRP